MTNHPVPTTPGEGLAYGLQDVAGMGKATVDALSDGGMWGYFIWMFVAVGIPMALCFALAYWLAGLPAAEDKRKRKNRNSRTR
jgi:hypothetical protein